LLAPLASSSGLEPVDQIDLELCNAGLFSARLSIVDMPRSMAII